MASDDTDKILAGRSNEDPKVIKFRKEWTIMNFHSVPKDKDHMLDKISSGNPEIGDLWQAEFRLSQSERNWKFSLFECNTPKIPILMRIRLMILTGNTVRADKSKNIFYKKTNWYSRNRIFETTVGDVYYDELTIVCEMIIVTNEVDIISYMEENYKLSFHTLENHLSHDMESLFNDQESGDFTFQFGDKNLRASRDILSARSPVFAAMFDDESDFKEDKEKCADISDIEYDVFREMLFYIYTDKVPKLNEMAEGLLAAAEKYQMKRLKVICEKALWLKLAIDNALDILIISDKCKCQQLRSLTIDYIAMHRKKILQCDKYKSLLTTNPALVKELIFEVFNREVSPEPEIIDRKRIKTQ